MILEKEFKRVDGKKVKIRASLSVESYRNEFKYSCDVFYCEPRKRTWKNSVDESSWDYRYSKDRAGYVRKMQAQHVSPEEIEAVYILLWHKVKPACHV